MVCTYNQLCPVMYGPDAAAELGAKAQEMGGKKAMLVYDKGIGGTGIVDRFAEDLAAHGIEVVKYDGVLPDAPKAMVTEAGQIARDAAVDMIIGIGGGSSLDTAKAVSVLAENPGTIDLYYPQKGNPFAQTMPLIMVPTASGTGSESTAISVIHDEDTDAKEFVLRPATLAILDPKLTLSVPPFVTAATGLDAMSHAVEALTTNCGNPKADLLGLEAVRLITENLPIAYADGSNLDARSNLSLASNFAGIAFADASVHFGHAAAHEMGIRFHMPHGDACAIALPEVIRFSADVIPEKTLKIAEALGVEVPEGTAPVEVGEMAAAKVRELMHTVGIKSLKDRGIAREDVVGLAKDAITKNWFVICALKPVDEAVMAQELADMYDNY